MVFPAKLVDITPQAKTWSVPALEAEVVRETLTFTSSKAVEQPEPALVLLKKRMI